MNRSLAAIIAFAFLSGPFFQLPGGAETGASRTPHFEWMSERSDGWHSNSCKFCDTDQDGLDEIFYSSRVDLKVFDPPSYNIVFTLNNSDNRHMYFSNNGPAFEDLGHNGSVQIIVYRDDSSGIYTISIYSGKDFT